MNYNLNIKAMRKSLQTLSVLLLFVIVSSCSSVRVASDYDSKADFKQYKTFAFFKSGIDKAEISDLDKRRILRAIESELMARGLVGAGVGINLLYRHLLKAHSILI